MTAEIKELFFIFQKEIFPIMLHVTEEEYSFMLDTINQISSEDIEENKHLSVYSFAICKENEKENCSRFVFGTKTKPARFQKKASSMLKSLGIKERAPKGFQWYGVGWDIEEDRIKIYFIKKDFSEIVCKEYCRSSAEKTQEKFYKVEEKVTIMKKGEQEVQQINDDAKDVSDCAAATKMKNLGFDLDTYSCYGGKTTYYFD